MAASYCWACRQPMRDGEDYLNFVIYSDDKVIIHEACKERAKIKSQTVGDKLDDYNREQDEHDAAIKRRSHRSRH